VWVHELAAFADPEEDLDLSTDEELSAFLNYCVPGARIGDPSAGSLPFLVEEFGDLPYYGWFSQYFNRAKNLSGWGPEVAVLRDAVDEETLNTMAWLAALSDMPTAIGKVAFSLEPDSGPDQPATFLLPVLANTARASTTVWLGCKGNVLVDQDGAGIRGISVEDVRTVNLHITQKFEKRTIEPEFLFHPRLVIARGRRGFHQVSSGEDYTNYPMLADLDVNAP